MTWTALHEACEHQNTEAILVRARTNPEEAVEVDNHGSTPLHVACSTNPAVSAVNALIVAFPQAVSDADVHGDTPLHVALRNPETSAEVVRALLKACPTLVSTANKEGLYPLHQACRTCATEEVIDALLEEYPYALRTPIKIGNPAPKRKSSLGNGKNTNDANLHPVVDGTRRLSGSAADWRFHDHNRQIRDGSYPLHMAIASKASKNVVEMLMREAPDVLRMTNKFGETPLHVAIAVEANEEIVELLLHTKEDLEALRVADEPNGNLPLHLAAIHGCCDGVAVLLLTEYPGAVRVRNAGGKTPLDLARENRERCSKDFLHLLERESRSPRNLVDASLQWPDD